MLMAEQKDRGEPPPEDGWPLAVLEYEQGTKEEIRFRKYNRPAQITSHESMIEFWRGRLAAEWVRQVDCVWGAAVEQHLGRLSEEGRPLIPLLTDERGQEEVSKASVRDAEGNFLPPTRSPWPFPPQ